MQEYFFKNEYIIGPGSPGHIASNFGKYETFFIGWKNLSIIIHRSLSLIPFPKEREAKL